jgi:hypothetical protein
MDNIKNVPIYNLIRFKKLHVTLIERLTDQAVSKPFRDTNHCQKGHNTTLYCFSHLTHARKGPYNPVAGS